MTDDEPNVTKTVTLPPSADNVRAAAVIRAYAERTHVKHPITEGCPRCDLTAALRACAAEIEATEPPPLPPSRGVPMSGMFK